MLRLLLLLLLRLFRVRLLFLTPSLRLLLLLLLLLPLFRIHQVARPRQRVPVSGLRVWPGLRGPLQGPVPRGSLGGRDDRPLQD